MGRSDLEWLLEKACLLLGLKGPGGLGHMKSEESTQAGGTQAGNEPILGEK